MSHDNRSSGHLGVRKTLAKLRQRYYWPGLQEDVRAYIAGCNQCSCAKGPLKHKRAPMQIAKARAPMERIATDILGELLMTAKGNKYILVISDYFSKWTECFPMRNMEAETVACIIVEQVITHLGVPYVIHSDQGAQYESQLFSEMCKLLGIKKTRITPYHPQSYGMVERFNKTLASMLRTYVDDHQRDWDTHLLYLMMAYRSAEHETTGCTPNLLMLGREVATPLDILYEMPSSITDIPQHKWAWELKERLQEAHAAVRGHVDGEMRRQKRYHDTKVHWQKFTKGDAVYVYFPQRKVGHSSKLTTYWRGPYSILKPISDLLYEMNCGRRGRAQVIHTDRIRLQLPQNLYDEAENTHSLSEDKYMPLAAESFDETKLELTDDLNDQEEKFPVTGSEESLATARKRRAPRWHDDYVL